MKTKNKKRVKLRWYSYLLLFIDICALVCFFFVYGPVDVFREWYVNTACSTWTHRYLAKVFYTDEYILKIRSKSYLIQAGDKSDTSKIVFEDTSNITVFENEYEEQVLTREEGNDLYKIIEFSEGTYSGFITVVYDAKRVNHAGYFNKIGGTVQKLANKYGALVAINASGYHLDSNNYKYPTSIIIDEHKIYYDTGKPGQLIGMNDDGVLMLYQGTAQEGLDAGLKWAVDFGPYLIVNGVKSEAVGYAGGAQPRTAIAQRKDGIILFLTIDGRGANGSLGATYKDMADLLYRYGAYNAANLDGGGSSTLVEKGVVLNHPRGFGYVGVRLVIDAIIVK